MSLRRHVNSVVDILEHCITDVSQRMSVNRLKLNPEKTELWLSGSRHSLRKLGLCGPTIKLGTDTIKASGHVQLLGVIMSSDLSLEKHVSVVSAACFSHLRQIRRVRQSLDAESAATLVHAFVTSGVDYCNAVLAGSPKVTTEVAACDARVISNTRKFDSSLRRQHGSYLQCRCEDTSTRNGLHDGLSMQNSILVCGDL